MLCFISPASPWKCNVGEQSSADAACFSLFVLPSGAGEETGELLLNVGISEAAAGLQSDTFHPAGSPPLLALV